MNRIQKARLLHAAEAVQNKDLNMETFVHHCGTPGCVLGWYAAEEGTPFTLEPDLDCNEGGRLNYAEREIGYDDRKVLEHFGISSAEAHLLFGPYGCDGAQEGWEAAKFIRGFVAAKTIEV